MDTIVIVLIVLFLLGVFGAPVWPYSHDLGWVPSGGVILLLVVLFILWRTGRFDRKT